MRDLRSRLTKYGVTNEATSNDIFTTSITMLYIAVETATITAVRIYISILLVAILLGALSTSLHAAKTKDQGKQSDKKNKKEAPEPEEWFVVEVTDLFDDRIISVCSSDEQDVIAKSVSKKNRSLDLAHRQCASKWTEAEKQRVEAQKTDKKRKEPVLPARPFVLPRPGLISMKVNGPFQAKADAEQNAVERAAALQKEIDFAIGADAQKKSLLAAQVLASLEAKEADEAKQRELFLAELESLNGKSSMLGGRENIKLMGGKIRTLVKNQHRMMKPGASAKTATKADSRKVK